MKKVVIFLVTGICYANSSYAALSPDANLSIDLGNASTNNNSTIGCTQGSCFSMELLTGFFIWTNIAGLNGINVGTVQLAPDIDQPWDFFKNTGMHQTTSPTNILSDDGAGNVTLDFSGWEVTWNSIPSISMNAPPDSGVASISCANTCENGDTYELVYNTHVPLDCACGFENVPYRLHLRGTISSNDSPADTLLADDTLLSIEPSDVDLSQSMCSMGSCQGIEVSPGFWLWSALNPGLDGGIIVGKTQSTGVGIPELPSFCQIISDVNSSGCLSTLPDATLNAYSAVSCVAGQCATTLGSLSMLYPGDIVSSLEVTNLGWTVNPDDTYELIFSSKFPVNDPFLAGVPTRYVLRGDIVAAGTNTPPTAGNLSFATEPFATVTWTPIVSDAEGDALSCMISNNAINGNATVAPDCSSGTFTSSDATGIDSFTYAVSDGEFTAQATAIVDVVSVPTACELDHPKESVTTTGGGQSATVNATVQTTFNGHITTTAGLTSGGKNSVKICPDTIVDYETTSSVGTALCRINGVAVANTGSVAIGDKLICTNKPDGSDTDRFSIKIGL